MSQDALTAQIENLVRDRNSTEALKQIKKYLKNEPSLANYEQAFEWYRRLSLYLDAYKICIKKIKESEAKKDHSALNRYYFWLSRLLYLLGATHYSYQILEKLKYGQKFENETDYLFAAEMYLANFEFKKALDLYLKFLGLQKDPQNYRNRIAQIGYADALVGVNKFAEAIEIIQQILSQSTEKLLQGILLSCLGEYEARQGHYEKALEHLKSAEAHFPLHDQTLDRALLDKWMGYALHRLGEKQEGRQKLEKSYEFFRQMHMRPEAWIEILRLLYDLKELKSESYILWFYPGLPEGFLARLPFQDLELQLGSSEASLKIYLSSEEFCFNDKWSAQLPLELKLLAWLKLVGSHGLYDIRVMNLLWPDQFYSLDTLDKRLAQLLQRIKTKYGFKVLQKDHSLYLQESDELFVCILKSPRPQILNHYKKLSAEAIQKFYHLSKSQSYLYLDKWKSL